MSVVLCAMLSFNSRTPNPRLPLVEGLGGLKCKCDSC